MMDNIRQLMVSGRLSLRDRILGDVRGSERSRRRSLRWSANLELLERRELLSTTQDFTTPGGTASSIQVVAGPPAPTVNTGGGPGGNNYLILATTPSVLVAGNDNSISFVTSDVGTFDQATASWQFRVTPQVGNGVGMSFALLNTANYSTSGGAFSAQPEKGIYINSLAFGFDTTNNTVFVSNSSVVTAKALPAGFLASGLFIRADASIDFVNAKVSLTLTPTGGSPIPVFSSQTVTGLSPYQSRVSLEAKNIAATYAEFDLTNINVQWSGLRQAGTIQFGSPSYTVLENQGVAHIDVVRTGGTAESFTINYVTADGTGRNLVDYVSTAASLTFGEGVSIQTFDVPILNNHLNDGNKTVKLFIGNPINTTSPAPLGLPIVATLTILNTNPAPPTVASKVNLVYAPGTRRVLAFRLTFSQSMDSTSARNVGNYQVLLPPAHKNAPKRVVPLSRAVLDQSGMFVTLYRASLGQHLTKLLQILVRGTPSTGLKNTTGTFLAGSGRAPGTDALLTVSV